MTHLELLKKKVISQEEARQVLACHRFLSHSIVFTNGCFDLLHLGHIDYLSKAADLGDVLIIGLNTDASVRRIKGPGRPLNGQQARSIALAALRFTSHIILFEDDTPENLIRALRPDVLVKGADYKLSEIAGHDFVSSYGGKTERIPLVEGFSTTGLLERISNR